MLRRIFKRATAFQIYKCNFYIASEGALTEPDYFKKINAFFNNVNIIPIPHKGSKPTEVLDTMKTHLSNKTLGKKDQAWIVIDRDNWDENDLDKISDWSKTNEKYGFVLNNPKIEYWFLLHFEEGRKITSLKSLDNRLRKYINSYNQNNRKKIFPSSLLDRNRFNSAISNAKKRGIPNNQSWPKELWKTTMYRLGEALINANGKS